MKLADLPSSETAAVTSPSAAKKWTRVAPALGLGLVGLLLTYRDAVVSMVMTWERSETYAHGFIVYPVTAWLIWRSRERLAELTPAPFLPGTLLLAALSGIWLVGELSSTQALREFALVASVPALVWTVLGTRIAAAIAIPLLLSLFAWPFGDFLVPSMIDRTADFTVSALRLTGIPVYREGNNFSIPSGDWSVVDACSGIRYLIASVYGGAIFAYLMFKSWRRRLLFMTAAVAVPVVANWVRAYVVVMVGHISNNKLAGGVDHLIYGWIFFGAVMAVLFYIGSRFSDVRPRRQHSLRAGQPASETAPARVLLVAAAAAVAAAASGHALVHALEAGTPTPSAPGEVRLPASLAGWDVDPAPLTSWQPPFESPSSSVHGTYRKGDDRVGLYLAYYPQQRAGAKMLTYVSTSLSRYHAEWRTTHREVLSLAAGGHLPPVIESRMQLSGRSLLAWQWYWVDGHGTVSPVEAKYLQLKARLLLRRDNSAVIVLYAPVGDDATPARHALRRFLTEMLPALDAELVRAAGR
jgi:exosortase A